MRRLLAYLRPHKWYVLGALLALDVVRPRFEFALGARLNHRWNRLLRWRDDRTPRSWAISDRR